LKEIALTQGKVALVDDSDFERLSRHKWYAHKNRPHATWYAKRNITVGTGKQRIVSMHREILGLEFGNETQGDHRDGNGLNNQRYNLRYASATQNKRNTHGQARRYSQFKGVCRTKESKPWIAHIRVDGVRHHIGYFYTEEAAALAYNEVAKISFGEFARLNVVQ